MKSRFPLLFLTLFLPCSLIFGVDKAAIFERVFGKAPVSSAQEYSVAVYLDGRREPDLDVTYYPSTGELLLADQVWLPIFSERFKAEALDKMRLLRDERNYFHKSGLETQGFLVKFDSARLALTIESPYQYRKKVNFALGSSQYLEASSYSKLALIPQSKWSGFVNFSYITDFNSLTDGGSNFNSLTWASNFNYNGWVTQTEGSLGTGSLWPFYGARVVHDDQVRHQRLLMGSFSPMLGFGNPLSVSIFGVGLRRAWADQPNYNPYSTFDKQVVLPEKGVLQLLLNDNLIFNRELPAGEYYFSDLGDYPGVNRLQVNVIRNNVTQNMSVDEFYFDQRLLASKAVEYGVNTGFPYRSTDDFRNFDMGTPLAIGYTRIGLDANSNLGSSLQVQHDYSIWGALAQQSSGVGLSEYRLNTSFGNGKNGFLAGAGLSGYLLKNAPFDWQQSYGLNFAYYSQDYADNALLQTSTLEYVLSPALFWYFKNGFNLQFQMDFNRFRDRGFLTALSVSTTGFLGPWTIQSSVRQGQNDPNLNFQVGFTWTEAKAGNRFEATYTSQPSTALRYSMVDPTGAYLGSHYFNSQYTSERDYQLGYTFNFNRSYVALTRNVNPVLGLSNGLNFYAEGQRGIVRANYTSGENGYQTAYGVESAFVFADGHTAISKPVADSFLILYPSPKLQGHFVEFDREYTLDSFGPAVISRLSSYRLNRISVTKTRIPLGVDLGRQSAFIVPSYGSGAAVEIGTKGDRFVIGSLVDADTQEPVPVSYAQLINLSDPKEGPRYFFTNKRGQFSLLGLLPGRYQLKLAGIQHEPVIITLTEADVTPVKLGAILVKKKGKEGG